MAVARVAATNAASASLTSATGNPNDLIRWTAFRDTAATIPTLASGTVSLGSSSGSTCAYQEAFEYAPTASAVSRTFTGATRIVSERFSQAYGLGNKNFAAIASSATMAYGAVTALQASSTSWFQASGGHRTASNVNTAPTGMSTITNGSVGTDPELSVFDTNAVSTGWTSQNVTVNATSGRFSNVIEILGARSTIIPYALGAGFVLSNNNLTATKTSGATAVAGMMGFPRAGSGKWVYRIDATHTDLSDMAPGMGSALTMVLTTFTDYVSWGNSGNVFINGSLITAIDVWEDGPNTVWLAFDFDNGLFWGKVSGKNGWNGTGANPDAGTGGISITTVPTQPCPAFSNDQTDTGTLVWDGTASGHGLSTFLPWDTFSTIYNVSITETGSAADSPSSSGTFGNTISETGTAADTTTGGLSFSAAISEAGSAADSPNSQVNYPVAISESGTAADSPSSKVVAGATITESGAAADSPNSQVNYPVAISESGAAADTVNSGANYSATITESGTAADTETGGLSFTAAITEAGLAADTDSASLTIPGVIVETGTAVDSPSSSVVAVATITEAGSAADSPNSQVNYPVSITEAGSAVDTDSNKVVSANAMAESGTAADTISNTAITLNAVSEAGNAQDSDSANGPLSFIAEVGNAQDMVSCTVNSVNSMSEAGSAADTVNSASAYNVSISETGIASDTISSRLIAISSIVETGDVEDTDFSFAIINVSIIELANAADVVATGTPVILGVAVNALLSSDPIAIVADIDPGPLPVIGSISDGDVVTQGEVDQS